MPTADRGWSSSSGVGRGANNCSPSNVSCYEPFKKTSTRTDPLVRPEQWRRDVRFGTGNVRSLYRAGSLTAAARELARYKLYFVGVQGVRLDKGGTVRGGEGFSFFCTRQNSISRQESRIYCWKDVKKQF